MTTQAYLEVFQNTVDVIEHSGGSIGNHPGIEEAIMQKKDIADPTAEQVAIIKKEAQEEYPAAAFLLNSDRPRYASLLQDLENDHLQGQDNYPKTITAAYNMLTNWKQDPRSITRLGDANDGVSFTNVDMEVAGTVEEPSDGGVTLTTDGTVQKPAKDKSHVTCHRCREKGHFANECDGERAERPARRQTAEQMLMAGVESGEFDDVVGFNFHQESEVATKIKQEGRVPKSWILLDNQSTVDVFHNASLLVNIRPGTGYMGIHCNAGVTSTIWSAICRDMAKFGTTQEELPTFSPSSALRTARIPSDI
jgi:hypothetical protein